MTEGRSDSIERLLAAIGYPERMSSGVVPFVLRVDGTELRVEEMDGRLVLSHALSDDDRLLPTLAGYAAGRMLMEDAVLSYDGSSAFLWQEAPSDADSRALLRFFETFMDSCDWWRDRVAALRGDGESQTASAPTEMMIRP